MVGSIAELEEATGAKVRCTGWFARRMHSLWLHSGCCGAGGGGWVGCRGAAGNWSQGRTRQFPPCCCPSLIPSCWVSASYMHCMHKHCRMHTHSHTGALPISCRWLSAMIWQQIKWRSPNNKPPAGSQPAVQLPTGLQAPLPRDVLSSRTTSGAGTPPHRFVQPHYAFFTRHAAQLAHPPADLPPFPFSLAPCHPAPPLSTCQPAPPLPPPPFDR